MLVDRYLSNSIVYCFSFKASNISIKLFALHEFSCDWRELLLCGALEVLSFIYSSLLFYSFFVIYSFCFLFCCTASKSDKLSWQNTMRCCFQHRSIGDRGIGREVIRWDRNCGEREAHICNLSFSTGIFPSDMKTAKVTPIFKSDARDEFLNYRPISLLPNFSKILEKLMFNPYLP